MKSKQEIKPAQESLSMGLRLVTIQTAFRNNSTKNYDKYTYVKPPNVLC